MVLVRRPRVFAVICDFRDFSGLKLRTLWVRLRRPLRRAQFAQSSEPISSVRRMDSSQRRRDSPNGSLLTMCLQDRRYRSFINKQGKREMQAAHQHFAGVNGGNERRARPRHAPATTAYVRVGDANGGVIADISETGMSIASAEPIQESLAPSVRFQLARIDRTFEISTEFIWKSDSNKKAGLRFTSLSVDERLQIRNWIKDEIFAAAFPGQLSGTAVARKPLPFSVETLHSTDTSARPNLEPREPKPRVAAKTLPDIPFAMPDSRAQEFERLFPSERTLGPHPVKRTAKFAAAEPAALDTKIDTTAYWMNFPSELDVPPAKIEVQDAVVEQAENSAAPAAVETPHDDAVTQSVAERPASGVEAPQAELSAQASATPDSAGEQPPSFAASESVADLSIASPPPTSIDSDAVVASELELIIEPPATIPDTAPATAVAENSPAATYAEPVVEPAESTIVGLAPLIANEIPVPEALLNPPSFDVGAEEASDVPVHELHPAPEGTAFAASQFDLTDVSKVVREPGKFCGGSVSDASIESLLAIAEDEDLATERQKRLHMSVNKRSVTPGIPTAAPAKSSPLPHVALRSASQQLASAQGLAEGDKKYRGLVVAASFIFIALCFAVGYSTHFRLPQIFGNSPTSTDAASGGLKPAAANDPPTASAPEKTATDRQPDSSTVVPDPTFKAPALPAAAPEPTPSYFPVTAPAEGSAPRMVELPENTAFDSPKVLIRLRKYFFVAPQPGPEWSHGLDRIQVGEATSKTPPPPASDSDSAVVHVRATIGKDGSVRSARPISGPVALIPRSLEAIRQWRYQPSLLEGQPVEWQGDFAIEFRPAP
jgi:Gram-negative bacterial TonB protein C-terminal/PilZ domain